MSENLEKVAGEKTAVKAKAKAKKSNKPKKDRKRPFREMFSELKKVTWPTKDELRTYTVCVIVFVVVSAILLFAMEFIVTEVINFLSNTDKLPAYLIDWFNIGG